MKKIYTILVVISILLVFQPCFAMNFKEYINKPIHTQEELNSGLRIEWEKTFGIDLFQGYFVINDLENTLREYFSINCAGFKGRLKIADSYKAIEYKFTIKF